MSVVIVCGGRDFVGTMFDARWLAEQLAALGATTVRHGGAPGADTWARDQAARWGLGVQGMLADWKRHGPKAGPLRNAAMLRREPCPVAVIAFPGGRGTADMVAKAKAAGVKVIERGAP